MTLSNADLAHLAAIQRPEDPHITSARAMAEDAATLASRSSREADSLGRMAEVFIEYNAPQMEADRRNGRFAMACAIVAVLMLALWGVR